MPLTTRLLLVLLVPIATCFTVQGLVNLRLRRDAMLAEASREVRDHGTALQVSLDAFLRDHRLADMAQLTEDLSRADRILGVLVFDARGEPVEASRSVQQYRGAFRALAMDALEHHRPVGGLRALTPACTVYAYAFPIGTPARGTAVMLRRMGYVDDNLRAYARQLALVASTVTAVLALLTYLAVRAAVLRPVFDLLRGVERVAEGDLSARIDDGARRDELGRLATSFNRMTASLAAAREELERKNAANVALERRLRHAQRLALIGQLSATVAHQVGSPLNVVLGRARYALKQGGHDERTARHLEEIAAGAERISSVIEGLLSQARRVRGPAGSVDLGDLARETVRFLEAECERARVVASVRAEEGVVVGGNRDELEQVILNLAMNALQAQPGGGRLEIAVKRQRGPGGEPAAEVTVTDAGPGVPDALRERIFEAFFTTKPASEGTGLGLAICDELVRRRGGTLSVEDAPGQGACFRVSLPLRGAPGPEAREETRTA
jgi:signal transduction histidine kinase